MKEGALVMSELIQNLMSTYSLFFDWQMWVEVLSDPLSWGLIGTLVIMEGLLSADNALVLAVMVRHLPFKQRKKALFYGLLGAYLFRFLAIGDRRHFNKIMVGESIRSCLFRMACFQLFP